MQIRGSDLVLKRATSSSSSRRAPQQLPVIPDGAVKKMLWGIEFFDNTLCKQIIVAHPHIVNMYWDCNLIKYEVVPRKLKQVTLLYVAAHVKNPYAVKLLLKKGALCTKGTADGSTPLHGAGNKIIAKLLVEKGGAPLDQEDANGDTPLRVALCNFFYKRFDVAHYLIKHGANSNHQKGLEGRTLLHELVRDFADNRFTISFLLERGADSNVRDTYGRTVLESLPSYNSHLSTLLKPTYAKASSFAKATADTTAGTPIEQPIVEMLGELDLNILDEHGNTLLHKNILWHKLAGIEYLINQYLLPITKNRRGKTVLDLLYKLQDQSCIRALHKAVFTVFFCTPCYKREHKIVKTFFKHAFASPHQTLFVRGIVHHAAQLSRESAYKYCAYLLKWGAPVNVKSQVGDFRQHDDKYPFALSWAVAKRDVDLIKLFLRYGAMVSQDMLNDVSCCFNKREAATIYTLLQEHYKKQQENMQV